HRHLAATDHGRAPDRAPGGCPPAWLMPRSDPGGFVMRLVAGVLLLLLLGLGPIGLAHAQPTLNAYSIWPESWAVPVFEEFTRATGIKVNFVRFSSGEALTRVRAERDNPRVDVLFGGPADTHVAGAAAGLFEPYKAPEADRLLARFKDPQHRWIGVADDPLV